MSIESPPEIDSKLKRVSHLLWLIGSILFFIGAGLSIALSELNPSLKSISRYPDQLYS